MQDTVTSRELFERMPTRPALASARMNHDLYDRVDARRVDGGDGVIRTRLTR